jgi:hypothetical protein
MARGDRKGADVGQGRRIGERSHAPVRSLPPAAVRARVGPLAPPARGNPAPPGQPAGGQHARTTLHRRARRSGHRGEPRAQAPAFAQQPAGAGPPTVEVTSLVGDPVSLLCAGRLLVFTGGTLVDRAHLSPSGDVHGTRHPVDATLSDGAGGVYRLHGTATYAFQATGSARFTLTGAVTAGWHVHRQLPLLGGPDRSGRGRAGDLPRPRGRLGPVSTQVLQDQDAFAWRVRPLPAVHPSAARRTDRSGTGEDVSGCASDVFLIGFDLTGVGTP